MKLNQKLLIFLSILCALAAVLCACSGPSPAAPASSGNSGAIISTESSPVSPTPLIVPELISEAPVQTVAPTQVPISIVTPTPTVAPSIPVAVPQTTTAPIAAATPTPAPTAAPVNTPAPVNLPGTPVVTKSPTDETVKEGGFCYFAANYIGESTMAVYFVSPDGTRDLTYEQAQNEFSTMNIKNGMYNQMKLENIPASANDWKVYCRYSNKYGTADTATATIHVTGAPAGTAAAGTETAAANNANLPIVTKSPTDETVKEGDSCYFVAKQEKAIFAVWHFVSPDGARDITYEEAANEFPTMTIENGMYGAMQLKNIPLAIDGWKVYCRYSNNSGSTDTDRATIHVNAA